MIDLHSHILPKMDDGSRHVSESLEMLHRLAEQGVRHVVATPHFYADHESVSQFLERRQTSYTALQCSLPPGSPEILLGAEVRYYPGISHLTDLKKLQIQGSRLLLLEMEIARWTEYTVRELVDLTVGGMVVVLAHVDRYIGLQNGRTVQRLLDNGILMQANADFFNRATTRRKALGMLKREQLHFLGSDCHNLTDRAPEIGKAYGIIEKKLGSSFAHAFVAYGSSMLL